MVDPLLGICAGVVAGSAAGALVARRLTRPLGWAGIPVLRWQLVGAPLPGSPLNELRVPTSQFEATLRHLSRRGFRPVRLQDALRRRHDPAFLATNPLVLTFDGPSATFANAAAALARHRLLPATLFFPAGLLGRPELAFPKGRPEPVLGVPDLVQLASTGVELGLLSSELAQKGEQALSQRLESDKRRLEEATGLPIELLALPLADAHQELGRAARAAGFQAAVLAGGDGVLRRRTWPWAIPRWNGKPGQHVVQLGYALAARRG